MSKPTIEEGTLQEAHRAGDANNGPCKVPPEAPEANVVKRDQPDTNLVALKQKAAILIHSGYCPHTTNVYQAMVKAMFGRAFGLSEVESQWGLHVVPGKPPSLSATLVGARIKASGRYDYRPIERTNQRSVIQFFERIDGKWVHVGDAVFTTEDAKRADLLGKDSWKKYPRAMLFNRALTEGARAYCPDVFFGNGIYCPEELDLEPAGTEDTERTETRIRGEAAGEAPRTLTFTPPPATVRLFTPDEEGDDDEE